ncbi:MAG TPA: tyrosine-type recombinase/integrase [Ktedonobacteraceae bacterium]
MDAPDQQEHSLVPLAPAAHSIAPYDDALARLGEAAEAYVRGNVFDDYHRKKSEGTKQAQYDDLATFSRFLATAQIVRTPDDLFADPRAWEGMKASTVVLFRHWLYYSQPTGPGDKRAGYAVSSVRRYLSTIRQYCKLAYQSGVLPSDEWTRIAAVKADSRAEGANIDSERERKGIRSRITTKKEYATPLDAEEVFTLRHTTTDAPRYRERDYVLTERDELLMCLLGEHGLRVGEVAALDARSINVRRKTIAVKRPKTHRQDVLSLMPATLQAAEKYLPLIDPAGPLFSGYGGRRITRQGIYKRVHELGNLAGIERLSPHDLRHYWTKDAFLKGNPLSVIQRYGGWESGYMPLRYAQEYGVEVTGLRVSTEAEDER